MSELTQRFSAGQILGTRERQEDDYTTLDLSDDGRERLLFIVADGMGGHTGAATVAQLAVQEFGTIVQEAAGPLFERLSGALLGANSALAMASIRDESLDGAGCTLLGAVVEDGTLSWISVGDCSLYLFRNGNLRKLNADHSMRSVFSKMVSAGQLSAKAAAEDRGRMSLRSALDGGEIPLIDASPEPLLLWPGDAVILASDGFECLGNRRMSRILGRAGNAHPTMIVERLLRTLREVHNRHQDNATVIVYSCRTFSELSQRNRASRPDFIWIAIATSLFLAVVYGVLVLGL